MPPATRLLLTYKAHQSTSDDRTGALHAWNGALPLASWTSGGAPPQKSAREKGWKVPNGHNRAVNQNLVTRLLCAKLSPPRSSSSLTLHEVLAWHASSYRHQTSQTLCIQVTTSTWPLRQACQTVSTNHGAPRRLTSLQVVSCIKTNHNPKCASCSAVPCTSHQNM